MKQMRSGLFLIVVMVFGAVAFAAPQSHVYTWSSGAKQGWLGVQLQDVTKKLKEKKSLTVDQGAYVTEVVEESPAEKAEMKEGDVIVSYDDKKITDSDDLIDAVRDTKRDTEVKIGLLRGAEKKTLTVKIDRAPHSYAYSFTTPMSPRSPRSPRAPRMPRMPSLPRMQMYGFGHGFGHGSGWAGSNTDLNGLRLQDLNKQLGEYFGAPDNRGVLIAEVDKGSEGDKAGFKAGDIITKIDGEKVRDVSDLADAVHDAKKNADLPTDVLRKGKTVSLKWHVTREEWYDDNDEDEDDDDTSMNMIIPDNHSVCQAQPDKLDDIRTDLEVIKETLRAGFHQVRAYITEKITELLEAVS